MLQELTRFLPTKQHSISLPENFTIKSGQVLSNASITFESLGLIRPELDNIILVFPGLSASAHIASSQFDESPGWWESMVGSNKYIDLNKWHVICCANLGSSNGSTGPNSINPKTGGSYKLSFPELSIEDMADAIAFVVKQLKIQRLYCVLGVSMGGMIALSFSLKYPELVRSMINISAGINSLPFSIALRSIQREIIVSDPKWKNGNYDDNNYPINGMLIARKLGMLSYQSSESWLRKFGRRKSSYDFNKERNLLSKEFEVNKYLTHHANIFYRNFDPNSYLLLSQSMDRYDVGEQIGTTCDEALSKFKISSALILGVTTDILFPAYQQEYLASGLEKCGTKVKLEIFDSLAGHDAFLTEIDLFGRSIEAFLNG